MINLNSMIECLDSKIKDNKRNIITIQILQFSNDAKNNLANILNNPTQGINGITNKNQVLHINYLTLSSKNFEKLQSNELHTRYSGKFETVITIDNIQTAYILDIGSFDLDYNWNNSTINSDFVKISNAIMTIYPNKKIALYEYNEEAHID